MKISVQICSFNRKHLLEACLLALSRVEFPFEDFEVILVDDGSTDGTLDMAARLAGTMKLGCFRQDHSGLAAARNLGIRNCSGEVVVFMDDDTLADPALLKEHWKTHEGAPAWVVMGWVNHVGTLEGPKKRRFRLADISTSFFWTSNVSVRRKHLIEAGLFDESFTEYGWEDIEFGHRLKDLGLTRKFNRKAIVYHYKTRWTGRDVRGKCRQAEASGRSAVVYLRKRPCFNTRLSTGIYQPHFWLNKVLRKAEPFFWKLVDRAGEGPLKGMPHICGRLLTRFHYYDAVNASLAAQGREQAQGSGGRHET